MILYNLFPSVLFICWTLYNIFKNNILDTLLITARINPSVGQIVSVPSTSNTMLSNASIISIAIETYTTSNTIKTDTYTFAI